MSLLYELTCSSGRHITRTSSSPIQSSRRSRAPSASVHTGVRPSTAYSCTKANDVASVPSSHRDCKLAAQCTPPVFSPRLRLLAPLLSHKTGAVVRSILRSTTLPVR
jgi:hypothetical protein